MRFRRHQAILAGLLLGTAFTPTASAQIAPPQFTFAIPAQDLRFALREVTRKAGLELFASPADLEGRTSPEISGEMSVEEALARLLEGTGLHAERRGDAIYIRGRGSAGASGEEAVPLSQIVVTGSRIRGASPASPLISIGHDDIRNAGQNDLGEAMRDLPQAFGGGQNPNVALGNFPTGTYNLNSASGLNLRGLGPDATLTLINGHRMAFSGTDQTIDIASIPLEAVERIEILTDGTSAIYGSDAVAGVANVILKRDYDGLAVSARLGAATEGGDFEQQYTATGGRTWNGGGMVATYEFARNTAVTAGQRDVTAVQYPTATVFPYRKSHSASLTAHQALGEDFEVSVDALYNYRRHLVTAPYSTTASYTYYGSRNSASSDAWVVAPSLRFTGLAGWRLSVDATYGENASHYATLVASGGSNRYETIGCYCAKVMTGEASADGSIVELPGGTAKLAVGLGYRRNQLDYERHRVWYQAGYTAPAYFRGVQESAYAYGEVLLPLVGPGNALPWLQAASLTGAARYERYTGTGGITTPKAGVIISPIRAFDIKGTWGRSFKAPTLYQQYLSQETLLYDVADGFGTGFPAGSTVLYRDGGNPDLKPERAENWTATIDIHPPSVPGLKLAVSAFHIRYTDRVVEPILSSSNVLSNGAYPEVVTLYPTQAQIEEAVASASSGLADYSSAGYDAANVVGIIDNRYVNVSRQIIKGLDLSGSYRVRIGDARSLTFTATASYLESRQWLSEGQAATQLAGIIFNPPHWRARGGLAWQDRHLLVAGYINYVAGEWDNRYTTTTWVKGQTTVDLATRYETGGTGVLGGLAVQFNVRNLFNVAPAQIVNSYAIYTPYDSTNYSGLGRIVSLQVSKRL